jgi:hypothetical protein
MRGVSILAGEDQVHKPEWAVGYEAKDQGGNWLVHYYPITPGVRGNAGDLHIEKTYGAVKLIRAYR